MKKNKLVSLISIFLIILVFTTGCNSKKETSQENKALANPDIIQLTPDAVKQSGISALIVEEKPVISQIVTTGQIKANEDKRFTINSIVSGRIIQDRIKLGDYVRQGQTVAVIQNNEVTQINANSTQQLHENRIAIRQAQTRYSLAKMNYEREKRLFKEGISPQKDYIQAQSDMIIAKEDLQNAKEIAVHIKSEARAMLGTYGVSSNLNSENLITSSPITALSSGVITKKNITVGSVVSPDQVLYEVSDLKELWLDITLYSNEIAKISEKQAVIFKPDSFQGKEFTGKIDYIQPASNEPTQTFIARAFINNTLGLLKPGMFGEIIINSNVKQNKPFVPEIAIQKYGKETFVFLDLGNGKYKKQVVQLAEKASEGHFINNGVKAGDKIVGTGSFTLKSELLKSEFAEEE
jgi:cobalt-zinc-cadmium efflux system membrane fusion protein